MGIKLTSRRKTLLSKVTKLLHPYRTCIYGYGMDISMDIHAKSVDMDMDMDGKFHIHGNPGDLVHMLCGQHISPFVYRFRVI